MFGMFIVFEGIDRSGKTTIVSKLAKKIESENSFGTEVIRMEFPNRESQTGELISRYLKKTALISPQAAHLLFSANRWEMAEFIKERRKRCIVLCDRYVYSGIAYSCANGMDPEWCEFPDKGLPVPDVVFFIDTRPQTAAKREGFGDEKYEDTAFLEKVYGHYTRILRAQPYCVSIDGSRSVDEIVNEIFRNIAFYFSAQRACTVPGPAKRS